tara:strand:+ start:642 stop:818 length:177 start_codon:yes stop_codon:yes gene_type:complete
MENAPIFRDFRALFRSKTSKIFAVILLQKSSIHLLKVMHNFHYVLYLFFFAFARTVQK